MCEASVAVRLPRGAKGLACRRPEEGALPGRWKPRALPYSRIVKTVFQRLSLVSCGPEFIPWIYNFGVRAGPLKPLVLPRPPKALAIKC